MFEDLKPHLIELRKRLIICVLSLVLTFIIAFNFNEIILAFMIEPLQEALNNSKLNSNFEGKITTHQVGGAFFVGLKVAFFASLLMSLPIILWQAWLFIAPGLYANEKRVLIPFVILSSLMFFLGTCFAYYIVAPFAFEFLLTFASNNFIPYINIEDYIGFFSKIIFAFGLGFELPILSIFLALIGLITDKSLKDFFKYALVIILIMSAILTPPDIMTQVLMAGPLILLYGISIIIVKLINPYKKS